MNPSYFFVTNQAYNFVDSSDPIFGNQKNYRTEHFLHKLIFQIRTSDREVVSMLNETSKKRIKFWFKEPVWSFSKFSQARTPWKRKNCTRLVVLLFQPPKNLPAKSFKTEAYFCAIRCFIAESYWVFDTPIKVSKNWHFSERNNSSIIDFSEQLVFQFLRDPRISVSCPWKFLSYRRLRSVFHEWI